MALAKTRVELMQANSQLYEAVRQKIDLGQQLEQWQVRNYESQYVLFKFLYLIYSTNVINVVVTCVVANSDGYFLLFFI